MAGALLACLFGMEVVGADEPNPLPTGPTAAPMSQPMVAPMSQPANRPDTLPPPAKLTWRDKLLHWPALIHSKPPCANCNLTDPDFCCSTCKSEWIFIFGSCHAFYGEPRSHQPFVYVPGP